MRFFPSQSRVDGDLAFERGVVRDIARESGAVVETCDYVIVWVREAEGWKISFHSWSVPYPEDQP